QQSCTREKSKIWLGQRRRPRLILKSLTEAIDTTTSGGKLIFSIFGALAEFERNLIRERTQVGLAAARARGRTGGRPPKMTSTKLA
ncbi:recombinase family protein, partial [Klebsiella pneumoniae]|uniref:recombinase family protein n=1 Tax=Klebsiella pneumoniae TaxID=573 RepID=UPI002731EB59